MATYGSIRYSGIEDAGIAGSGTIAYANPTDLPTSGVTTGAMAYVSASNKLYMWNGTAWFNIAIVNQAPTAITGNQATYALSQDGTPTVVTLVSTDPEGLPLTFSSSTSGDTQVGTVTNTDNVFTITPSTNEADMGTLSVTFSVTDGNNTETSVSSFTLEFLSPYWDETVLSIGTSSTDGLTNNTFIDRSTNTHTVTPTGAPVQTVFHPYLDNWSVEFGDNNYLTLGATVVNNMSSGTFEFWINVPDLSENFICAKQINSVGTEGVISITNYSTSAGSKGSGTAGRIYFHPRNGINAAVNDTAITPNKWHHIAVSFSTSQVQFFLDGASDGITLGDFSIPNTTSQPWRIGWWGQTSEIGDFKGYLSNFRVSDNVRYSNSFTPVKLSSDSNTLLLTCQSNRFVDNSSNAHVITPAGNVEISAFNPFGQETEYAAGENKGSGLISPNNYLNIADPTNNFHLNNQEFAFEFWLYLTPDNLNGSLVSKWWSNYTGYRINCGADGTIGFYNVLTSYTATTKASINAWTHYACTRDSAGILRQFVNGVLQRSDAVNPNNASGSTSMIVGTLHSYPTEGLNKGYISDFRLVKGAPIYTTNFTPPTAPVGNTNASLYLPFDNAGIFDKTGNNTLTPVGNASTSTTYTKYADTAMYFDGSGDYVLAPSSDKFDFGTRDFSIELWAFFNTVSVRQCLVSNYLSSVAGFAFQLGGPPSNSDKLNFGWGDTALITSASLSWSTGTWYHLAVARSGTSLKLFRDGLQVASTTNSTNLSNSTALLTVGALATLNIQPSNGYIENLQILKGVAKYTANFTPPNRTQGITYQAES